MGGRRSTLEDLVTLDFWRGKRVFITGHTGFKGAWLSFMLSRLGADVTGFALPPNTEPSLFDLLNIQRRVSSRLGDVRDLFTLGEVMAAANPEIVFHMAAQALVREGYADPVVTFGTNVIGTVNALESARNLPDLRALVVVTSDKCYFNDDRRSGYSEEDRLGGDDPYSCSKACAELVTSAYRKSFFQGSACAVATARAGNVIGGGDWSRDRLVPDVVRGLVSESPVRLRNPAATRPWQHVLEPLFGYLKLAERLYTAGAPFAQAWNFGPPEGESATVAELVNAIFAAWNRDALWETDPSPQPAESQNLAVDAAKARSGLDWAPRLPSAETIGWTVEWYKAWHSGAPPESIASQQIDRYLNYRS
jgi:CDP-glucose 4,6-dehydratase